MVCQGKPTIVAEFEPHTVAMTQKTNQNSSVKGAVRGVCTTAAGLGRCAADDAASSAEMCH